MHELYVIDGMLDGGEEEGALAWQEDSLCAQTDPEAFFPEKGGSTREAKKVCVGCKVSWNAWSTRWGTTSASASGAAFRARTAQAQEARGVSRGNAPTPPTPFMTLAPPRPQNAPSDPGGVEPTVTAVLVSRRDPQGFAELLEAVLTQSHALDAVLVLDRTGGITLPSADGDADGIPLTGPAADLPADLAAVVDAVRAGHPVPIEVRAVEHRTPVRAAVHRALLAHELDGAPTTLAWVLPVGAVPEPGALGVLLATWRRSPSTGLVGPKHLDSDDPHVLRALAIRATRGGRLLPRPVPGEPDQGQLRPRLPRPRRAVRRGASSSATYSWLCAGGRPPSATSPPTSTSAGAPTTSAAASWWRRPRALAAHAASPSRPRRAPPGAVRRAAWRSPGRPGGSRRSSPCGSR